MRNEKIRGPYINESSSLCSITDSHLPTSSKASDRSKSVWGRQNELLYNINHKSTPSLPFSIKWALDHFEHLQLSTYDSTITSHYCNMLCFSPIEEARVFCVWVSWGVINDICWWHDSLTDTPSSFEAWVTSETSVSFPHRKELDNAFCPGDCVTVYIVKYSQQKSFFFGCNKPLLSLSL